MDEQGEDSSHKIDHKSEHDLCHHEHTHVPRQIDPEYHRILLETIV